MDHDQPPTVLIVEDDPLIALAEVEMVEACGYEVIGVAAEAETTYRIAQQRVPSVALLDVNLADGCTGPAICAKLVGEYGVPVVFVTGNPELLPENFAGAIGCIEKPYLASTLTAVLAFVRRYAQGGAAVLAPHGLLTPPLQCA